MGHSHYWETYIFTDEQWEKLQKETKKLRDEFLKSGFTLESRIGYGVIDINGAGDEGCENLVLLQTDTSQFCKTMQRPYDALVLAVLMTAGEINPEFKWSTDASEDHNEFEGARGLIAAVKRPDEIDTSHALLTAK